MTLPDESLRQLVLQRGAIFLFSEKAIHDTIPHYFVILNKNPKNDEVIIIPHATSNPLLYKHYTAKVQAETIIEVRPTEIGIQCFDQLSRFNCNEPHIWNIEKILKKLREEKFKFIGRMPDKVLDRLAKAVRKSKSIKRKYKKFV